ncbi:membrane-spanning 4-domains subfamily A member 8-like [Rousettus aegyptiacus]|uniref:Membrane spanning 4-domains A8 n=1 Tax=Rousettus aegyptiacus TaxID=9407 RepID=A0A7J8H319_ROUAE|nr:membrane-spanning 4-domains subfamily A member 8-like [Rousettus aegyptiacus]KAF6466480.1 membrane spanning 4-domains A8 [Rousettus aegyptiacus]
MNPMTSAGSPANSVFVVTPQNPYPTMPGAVSQQPLYPRNQPQVHQIPGNLPGPQPTAIVRPAQRALKEGKVLGAIQILIGLLHIGLGFVMASILPGYYIAVSFVGGFPFWGSIWFIISGSLSVAAEKQSKSCLVNCSLGFNIVSALSSVTGVILCIIDIAINAEDIYTDYYTHWGVTPGMAVSSMLLIFSFLEFCIACTTTHFGCRLACYSHDNVPVAVPSVLVTHSVVIPEAANPPPAYSTVAQAYK